MAPAHLTPLSNNTTLLLRHPLHPRHRQCLLLLRLLPLVQLRLHHHLMAPTVSYTMFLVDVSCGVTFQSQSNPNPLFGLDDPSVVSCETSIEGLLQRKFNPVQKIVSAELTHCGQIVGVTKETGCSAQLPSGLLVRLRRPQYQLSYGV